MKIIFVKEYNTPLQGFDVGQICEMPKKAAKPFIKDKFAKEATKAQIKAAEEAAADAQGEEQETSDEDED